MKKRYILVMGFLVLGWLSGQVHAQTFTNPLLPAGADPFSFYKDGYYYYTHTLGDRIGLWKTKSIAGLVNAEHKIIYNPTDRYYVVKIAMGAGSSFHPWQMVHILCCRRW